MITCFSLGLCPLVSSSSSIGFTTHALRNKVHLAKQKSVDLSLTLGYWNPHGCNGFSFGSIRSIYERVTSGFKGITVMTDDQSIMSATEEDLENIGILHTDPALEPYKDHFRYRVKRYVEQKKLIEAYEGGLEEFALGYLKFGFNREEGAIVYREWAPAAQEAQIIGDFNGWDGSNHRMEKNQFGVWSIKIPDVGGNPAIPHNSRVKFRFRHSDGVWVDRIPAWIRYATVDPTRFAAPYDGVYWDPPLLDRLSYSHVWNFC